jgi:hypothetical protein
MLVPSKSPASKDCAWLAALVAVSRFAFRSRFLYDIDSVNFALAIGKFAPAVHQPHPPGYFLYVMLGRLLNYLTGDANTAFVAISIAASCGSVVMIYLLASDWFGRGPGICSALMFVLSPLAWFHGTVALTYVTECFFSAAIGYLSWCVKGGGKGDLALCALLGVAAGFRPSSIVFLGPLCGYAIYRGGKVRLLISGGVVAGVCLAWFVPMMVLAGGFRQYFQSLSDLWSVAAGKSLFWASPLAYSVARVALITAAATLCFGAGAVFAFSGGRTASPEGRKRLRFTWVWIGPGLLFFTFVFLRFVNSGYLLFLSPPLFAYLGRSAYNWAVSGSSSRNAKALLLVAGAAANMACFLWAPFYCSYGSVREFEAELVSYVSAVRRTAPPADTLLVGFDSHFLGYRHAAYYLPEYLTVQYPELIIGGQRGAFAAQNRQTEFLRHLPRDRYTKFVLLPLPPGDEERAYLRDVYGRFSTGKLQEKRDSEWLFETGSQADLNALFENLR